MVDKLRIIYSEEVNPWYNLALEEYLLDQVADDEVMLYLWQNDRTVVIGRNQNAWKECRFKKLEKEDGGFLARRLSGGGAVYHDLGNFNFTFLADRDLYDLEKQLSVILEAVREIGIEANFSGRNDLLAAERKFSGNAFYFTGERAYHHGTVLVDSDFEALVGYLQVSEEKIKSKGIDSVRSRVINLKELSSEITVEELKEKVAASFLKVYGNEETVLDEKYYKPSQMPELEQLFEKYSSWEWRYGMTPDFDITFSNRFSWGEIQIGLSLKDGYIKKVEVYSDAMEVELIAQMSTVLEELPFQKQDIIAEITKLDPESTLINDINKWLTEKKF